MITRSITLGRIFGIEIQLSYTWFLVFFLVTLNLFFIFSSEPESYSAPLALIAALFTALMFFSSVLFHEISHSLIAKRYGIDVPRITLFIFGGMAQIEKDAKTPGEEFKIAVAGPLSSIVLSIFFGSIYVGLTLLDPHSKLAPPFFWLSGINLTLALFNLVPGFPLDGGRVLRSAIWKLTSDVENATRFASYGGQIFAVLLILAGFVSVLFGNVGGIWFILIGWFLNNAAEGSYQQMLLTKSLENYIVSQIMNRNVIAIPVSATLDHLLEEYFFRYRYGRFPVVDDTFARPKLVGMITLHDIREVPRENWGETNVGDVMEKITGDMCIDPEKKVLDALYQMSRSHKGQLMVTEDSELVGMITKGEIMRLIQLQYEMRR